MDFSVEHCVVGEKFERGSWRYVGGHVIYIEKEEEGSKNSTLWDSRAHVYLTRLAPFYQHFLSFIGKKLFNPKVGAGSNFVVVQFVEESIMGDSVESLIEI